MFTAEAKVIPYFETMCAVDQGWEVNAKVEAALRIVKNAMEAREDSWNSFNWIGNEEIAILNGAKINLGLYNGELSIYQTWDLHEYSFDEDGAEIVIDYLAGLFKVYYDYAVEQLKKTKKRSRRK